MKTLIISSLLAVAIPALALVPANQSEQTQWTVSGPAAFSPFCNMQPWSCPTGGSVATFNTYPDAYCNMQPWHCTNRSEPYFTQFRVK